MIYRKSKFKHIKRNYSKTLVFLPGWATDYRIFGNLELPYDYFIPEEISLDNFNRDLLRALEENNIQKVSLFGWSLGAFLAIDFFLEHPVHTDELFLLGVRSHYERQGLLKVRADLERDKTVCLSEFYANCFSSFDAMGREWFKGNLQDIYLKEMNIENLFQGLDYLASARIDADSLRNTPKIKFFHGKLDRIAPFIEAEQLRHKLNHAEFITFHKLGHNLFLNAEFAQRFSL